MKDFLKTVSDSMGDELVKGLALALAVIMLFSVGFFTGSVAEVGNSETEAAEVSPSVDYVPVAPSTNAPETTAPPAPSEETTAASSSAETETTAPTSGEKSVAEIVALYNESANKVKTNATMVIKNYEDREMQEEKLNVPGALKALANSMIPKFMGDDTEPVEYATKDEIVANFMVPEQSYVSQMTEADVAEATCTDNGTEYEIMIKMKETVNPSAGVGVGSAFDVIEAADVSESVDFVTRFDATYYDCVLKCKIEKSTGNMIWANYLTPLVMEVTVNMFGTHDASIGLSFEKDYTIKY